MGLGSTSVGSAVASISSGIVTTLNLSGYGTGYTSVPDVLIEPPKQVSEKINVLSYTGDYGVVVGVGTTVSSSQNQFIFDLYIPTDSYMRDTDVVGSAITVSGLSTGDFLTVYDTSISIGGTFNSEYTNSNPIGIGTTFLDCVYQVESVETRTMTNVTAGSSVGITTEVRRIFVNVDTVGTGIAYTTAPYLGEFSWGKINFAGRTKERPFNFYGSDGYVGISTSGLVTRFNPLKYKDYVV